MVFQVEGTACIMAPQGEKEGGLCGWSIISEKRVEEMKSEKSQGPDFAGLCRPR